MAVAAQFSFADNFASALNEVLFTVCEELQLSPSRYSQAEERYNAVAKLLELPSSPFVRWRPLILPQGSMALGTTVHPLVGPHDLDFVLELAVSYLFVNPMTLLLDLYNFLKGHGTYADMVELKNRCVRIVYANEFYLDILPGCRDHSVQSATCIQVPDREAKGWKPSNPRGYIKFFEQSSIVGSRLIKDAVSIPAQEEARQKRPLQLVVQLLKRWRDLFYDNALLAPISIVLTTLAARNYRGQASVAESLSCVLDGIWKEILNAQQRQSRVIVLNPSNPQEDLSERWEDNPEAYDNFVNGIAHLRREWHSITAGKGNVHASLEELFGETVRTVIRRRAEAMQEMRKAGQVGVNRLGSLAVASGPGVIAVRPNTFHGPERRCL